MSLVNKIVEVVETIGADIKALYAGKAEKEHTHTKSDVGLRNVDNTKDVDKRVGGFVIHDTRSVVSVPNDVPSGTGLFEFKSTGSVGHPPKPAYPSYAHVLTTNGWTADGTGGWPTQISLGDGLSFRKGTGKTTWGKWHELISTNTTLGSTGQSTLYPMTQKAVTDNLDNLGAGLDLLRQELDNLKDMLPHDIFPAGIGDERWGGFYIGDITIPSGDDAGTYMVIMAGEEGEAQEKWKLTGTNTTGTTNRNNGKSNTLGMVNAGISEHPAGEYCVNYRGGGFDDWYLPAINEVALAWDNRALLGDLKMGASPHWSSTQSTTTQARDFDFYREKEDIYSKTSSIWVRPVRRIKKS